MVQTLDQPKLLILHTKQEPGGPKSGLEGPNAHPGGLKLDQVVQKVDLSHQTFYLKVRAAVVPWSVEN